MTITTNTTDFKPQTSASSLPIPIAQFRSARALFFATVIGTIAIYAWLYLMRHGFAPMPFAPIFAVLLCYYDYFAAMAMLLMLLGAVFVPIRVPTRHLLQWMGERQRTIAILTFVACSVGTLAAYHNHPLSMDEYAPLFQSKVFATGKLTGQFPPEMLDWLIPPGFQNYFLYVSRTTGEVASFYWPSHALLMTPFTLVGIPWALNPLLSALTVIVLHRIAMHIFNNAQSAGLVVLFTVASPVFFADAMSYYSMTAHLLMSALYMLMLLEPTAIRLVAAGFVGSVALTLHNPVPHILFAIPWLVWIATRERGFIKLLQLAAGYLPLSILLGIGWFWFIGNLAHQGVADPSQLAQATGTGRVGSFFSLPTNAVILARLAGMSKVWLWAVPGLVLLAVAGAWNWRTNIPMRLLATAALTTLVGYLFIWPDQGHGWGFRYFHSAWLALPLLGAAALTRPPGERPDQCATDSREGLRTFAVACALASLLVGVSLRAYQIDEFLTDHLSQRPPGPTSTPRVLIIDPSRSFYGVDLVQNDPFLRGGVVTLLSHGTKTNEELMGKFRPDYGRVTLDSRGEVWVPSSVASSPQ